MKIDPRKISVRDPEGRDIPMILDYWYRSPPGYVENMGMNPAEMPSEAQMEENLRKRIADGAKGSGQIIDYDGRAIGMHSIFPVTEGEEGVMHAHIAVPEFRGRGVGMVSYLKAARVFMARFRLKRIVFQTPLQNKAAIRVKEKLGIRRIGDCEVDVPTVRKGMKGALFELTAEELQRLEDL